jgi:hypothetical protein
MNKKRKLTKQETDRFLYAVDQNEFWNLAVFENPKDSINLDGAQWIFEGAKSGKYHVTAPNWFAERCYLTTRP